MVWVFIKCQYKNLIDENLRKQRIENILYKAEICTSKCYRNQTIWCKINGFKNRNSHKKVTIIPLFSLSLKLELSKL